MLVYHNYRTFYSRKEVVQFCQGLPGPWKTLYSFLGFYKEQGGYAECTSMTRSGAMRFRYTTEKDRLIKTGVERGFYCAGETLDLLFWMDKNRDQSYVSLVKYMGIAKQVEVNLYEIPA